MKDQASGLRELMAKKKSMSMGEKAVRRTALDNLYQSFNACRDVLEKDDDYEEIKEVWHRLANDLFKLQTYLLEKKDGETN